jgi:hypothetical protein
VGACIRPKSRNLQRFFLTSHNFPRPVHHYQGRITLKNGDTGEGPDLNLTGDDFLPSPLKTGSGDGGGKVKVIDEVSVLMNF